jgi:hypothetical protein
MSPSHDAHDQLLFHHLCELLLQYVLFILLPCAGVAAGHVPDGVAAVQAE